MIDNLFDPGLLDVLSLVIFAAWTTPRTWVTGETVTAAICNTHIKDNLVDLDGRAFCVFGGIWRDIDAGETSYVLTEGLDSTTETDRSIPWAAAGTISHLYVEVDAEPSAGDSYTFTFRKNAADQATVVTISNTATTGNDTSNSFTVAAGDLIALKVVATGGTPANTVARWSARFTPS